MNSFFQDIASGAIAGIITTIILGAFSYFSPRFRAWVTQNWKAILPFILIIFVLIADQYGLYQLNKRLDTLSQINGGGNSTQTTAALPDIIVEQLTPSYEGYSGDGATYDKSIENITLNGNTIKQYVFDYEIPLNGPGWANVKLAFPQPVNIAQYNNLEMDIAFDDPSARCFLTLYDDAKQESIDIILGDGAIVKASTDRQHVRIRLTQYVNGQLNTERITALVIAINDGVARGKHRVYISNIRFTYT